MPDLQQYMSAALWLLAVIGLFILAFLAFKMLTGSVRGRRGTRLGVSEYYEIDKTRRLVLVRRDDTEHLILIGGHQDMLIEGGIPSQMPQREAPHGARPAPAPRPAVFAERKPVLRPIDGPPPRDPNMPKL